MNITCTFASSIDIALKCSVELKGPMTKTVEIDKVTASRTATKMVNFRRNADMLIETWKSELCFHYIRIAIVLVHVCDLIS